MLAHLFYLSVDFTQNYSAEIENDSEVCIKHQTSPRSCLVFMQQAFSPFLLQVLGKFASE